MECLKEQFWIVGTPFFTGIALSFIYLYLRYDVSLFDMMKIATGRKRKPDDWRLTLIGWVTVLGSLGLAVHIIGSCSPVSAASTSVL